MKEYDVHFELHGFYYKVEANSPEEAKEKGQQWLTGIQNSLEHTARTGLGIEMGETILSQ